LPPRLADYVENLRKNGYDISMTESTSYVEEDRDYIKVNFYSALSPRMVVYLEQLNKENKEGYCDDGSIMIGNTELIDRIVWWENFNKENKTFLFRELPYHRQQMYTSGLIAGEDNSPLLDDKNELNIYFRNAYDYLFNKYADSESAKLLKPYYAALIKNDTAAIKEFKLKYLPKTRR
jgi:hypothetical protein